MTQLSSLLAKIQAADSNSSVDSLHQLMKEVDRYGSTSVVYDSAGVLPNHPSFIGSAIVTGDGGFYVFTDSAQWELVDSSVVPEVAAGWSFQGSSYGYSAASSNNPGNMQIQKYSFTADGNSTNTGTLSGVSRGYSAGQSSSVSGYTSGGYTATNVIDKFPFAADGDATDVGDLVNGRGLISGHHNETTGYITGGYNATTGVAINGIEKFSFVSDGNATSYGGVLTVGRYYITGMSSETHGYNSQGNNPSASNVIDKFSFASEGNATDVGDAVWTGRANSGTGASSTTDGFTAGGSPNTLIIQKYSFTSDGNSTNVGSLTSPYTTIDGNVGTSATDYAYFHGGNPSGTNDTTIQKFPYAITSGSSTSVGTLATQAISSSGQQI